VGADLTSGIRGAGGRANVGAWAAIGGTRTGGRQAAVVVGVAATGGKLLPHAGDVTLVETVDVAAIFKAPSAGPARHGTLT
jgi:hypothetical protein